MSNPQVTKDIKLFVHARLEGDQRFRRWSKSLREVVKTELSIGAKGMFRWAACQLDTLRRLALKKESDIRNALKTLPPTLDETYLRILSSVDEELRPLLRHVLRWIIFRSEFEYDDTEFLEPDTIVKAFQNWTNINQDHVDILPDDMHSCLEMALEACGCLLSKRIDRSTQEEIWELAHFTVSEFLRSGRILTTPGNYFAILPDDTFLDYRYLILETASDGGSSDEVQDSFALCCREYTLTFPYSRDLFAGYLDDIISSFRGGRQAVDRLVSCFRDPKSLHISVQGRFSHRRHLFELNQPRDEVCAAVFTLFQMTSLLQSEPPFGELASLVISGLTVEDIISTPIHVMKMDDEDLELQGTLLELVSALWVILGLRLNFEHLTLSLGLKIHNTTLFPYLAMANMFRKQGLPKLNVWYNNNNGKILARAWKDLIACTEVWFTPLQLAVIRRDLEAIRDLLQLGANADGIGHGPGPNTEYVERKFGNFHGLSPLEIVCSTPGLHHSTRIQKLLLRYGAQRGDTGKLGTKPVSQSSLPEVITVTTL